MYQPAHFSESRPEVLQALVRSHPFGILVTQDGAGEISANGVPFVLDADPAGGPGILRAHVARANPLWQAARADRDSLVVFQGPQAYISPAWYPAKVEHGKVVPTWNYVMVQARGRLRAIDDPDWLHAFVTRLTERHEQPRAAPWAVSDAPPDYVASMLKGIVGLEMVVGSLSGKWKVTQNRSAADRDGVARALAEEVGGDEARALARQVASPGVID
jgi:transcriptional regulator